jgi:hypothetical protein
MNEELVKDSQENFKEKIKSISTKPTVSYILKNAYWGLLIYLILFIIGQIVISGGKAERDPYFVILMVIFSIAAQIMIIKKEFYEGWKKTLIAAVTVTLVFAILDYLIVNLWLEKNNLVIFKYWPYYFIYLSTLATPFIRSNWSKLPIPNLKSLLTKKRRTL